MWWNIPVSFPGSGKNPEGRRSGTQRNALPASKENKSRTPNNYTDFMYTYNLIVYERDDTWIKDHKDFPYQLLIIHFHLTNNLHFFLNKAQQILPHTCTPLACTQKLFHNTNKHSIKFTNAWFFLIQNLLYNRQSMLCLMHANRWFERHMALECLS